MLRLLPSPETSPLWLRVAMDCDLSRPEIAAVLHEALLVAAAKDYRLVQVAEAQGAIAELLTRIASALGR